MKHLLDAVRDAVREKNWYAALGLVLSLPDIAAELDGRTGTRARDPYLSWYDDYLLKQYARGSIVFLSGADCYALRCAFLHLGDFDITTQRARETLDRFQFVAVPPGSTIHCYMVNNNLLQLQIDVFCEDVCKCKR